MDNINAKELKKLADACRKAGIKSFKGHGIEFTLTDEAPVSTRRQKASKSQMDASNDNIETDGLSEEELLFWSVGNTETDEIVT